MLGGVEPPRVRPEAEELDDLLVELLLAVDGEVPARNESSTSSLRSSAISGISSALSCSKISRTSAVDRVRLEVVEQDVVRLVDVAVALDVAAPELEFRSSTGRNIS